MKTEEKYLKVGLTRCEFDDECEFCENPENGSYVELVHIPEDVTEADYYACGKCVDKAIELMNNSEDLCDPLSRFLNKLLTSNQ